MGVIPGAEVFVAGASAGLSTAVLLEDSEVGVAFGVSVTVTMTTKIGEIVVGTAAATWEYREGNTKETTERESSVQKETMTRPKREMG